MSSKKQIVRSAWGITLWTFVARITGLFREAIVAKYLGASAASDAFVTAFRLPNAFRAIVGEGGLPGAFVPMAKKIEKERPGEEGLFAGRFFVLLSGALTILVVLGIVFAPLLVQIFASGFRATPGKFELAVFLTRLLFPYIFLISLASLLEAYLNSKGTFQLSAATPVVFNICIILAALGTIPLGVSAPLALCAGVLFGGTCQLAMQFPRVRKLGFRFAWPFGDRNVKETALRIVPRLYGFGVGQINFLISSNVLASLGDAYVTYNYFAFRMADLVRGGFVESITRTLLPSLSEKALEKDPTEFRDTIQFGLRLSAFVTLPATAALILFASPLIDIALRRGRFSHADVEGTQVALAAYGLGLFAIGGVKILTQAFFALHDTRTPVAVATFDLGAFVLLCLALKGPFRHVGVALATSAGFWINFLLLLWLLRKRVPRLLDGQLLLSAFRLVAASLLAAGFSWAATRWGLPYNPSWNLVVRGAWLAVLCGIGGAAYLVAAQAMRSPEVAEVLGVFRKKRAK